MNHRRNGFTLTEMLVVIGLTGMFAGLLSPSLCKAKSKARVASCQNNLRQLGLALSLYVGDFHRYPTYIHWAATSVVQFGNQQVLPYTGNKRNVFRCPAHCPRSTLRQANPRFSPLSYGYNSLGSGSWMGPDLGLGSRNARSVLESQVRVPSDMIALGDVGSDSAWDFLLHPNAEVKRAFDVYQTTANSWLPGKRHRGGANVLFCDGHIEHAAQEQWIEKTEPARRRWNNDHLPHPETW